MKFFILLANLTHTPVAHALASTPGRNRPQRSHDCERGTHECVRHT